MESPEAIHLPRESALTIDEEVVEDEGAEEAGEEAPEASEGESDES